MKKFLWTLLVLTTFTASLFAKPDYKSVDWESFSQNIEVALGSKNIGLKQSAMQMIVKYNDHLNVTRAADRVVKEFTSNKNQEMRKLALIALYKIKDDQAVELFKKHRPVERNIKIRETMDQIISAYEHKEIYKADKIVNDVYLSLDFKRL